MSNFLSCCFLMKLMKNGQHIYYIGSKTGIRVRRPCAFDRQDSFQKSKTGILYRYHFFFIVEEEVKRSIIEKKRKYI